MKKLMLLAAGIAASVLAACASAPQLTFQQQVSIACGAAQGEIAILKADNVFTGGAANTLANDVEPAIAKVCAAGATVSDANLQSVVNATLPLIKSLVDASSLPQDKKNAADAAVDTAVLAFNIAVKLAPTGTTPAPVAAASSPAAK
ncbi:hypothetical protein [Ralstonia solanacearum]|uniref:hypothetical protein n=1 Tax=Ralstonia solanacearum TaxID=305 RepID=UPI000E66352F|nr:hypothetical protein [Ralstonia solanacearum]RIJ85026.1 hypothetical protein RSP822_18350 [Ralstonia solanacearum]